MTGHYQQIAATHI